MQTARTSQVLTAPVKQPAQPAPWEYPLQVLKAGIALAVTAGLVGGCFHGSDGTKPATIGSPIPASSPSWFEPARKASDTDEYKVPTSPPTVPADVARDWSTAEVQSAYDAFISFEKGPMTGTPLLPHEGKTFLNRMFLKLARQAFPELQKRVEKIEASPNDSKARYEVLALGENAIGAYNQDVRALAVNFVAGRATVRVGASGQGLRFANEVDYDLIVDVPHRGPARVHVHRQQEITFVPGAGGAWFIQAWGANIAKT